ncbi:MAG: hypothetical protein ACPL8I_04670, partial [Chloroflexaceae bacterium]
MYPASGPHNPPAATPAFAKRRPAGVAVAARREGGGGFQPLDALTGPATQPRVASARLGGPALALGGAALAAAAQYLFLQRAAFSWTALGLAALATTA